MKYLLSFLIFTITLFAQPKHNEKVSLQLMWLDQFQFAGYYMAKEKGFYADVNLEVDIKKYKANFDTTVDVLAGKTNFGVGRSSLIQLSSTGKKIVLLSAIYQSSPLVLIALKSSNINTIQDFPGKTIMLTKDGIETASIHVMIRSSKIDESKLKFKKHNFQIDNLINKEIDLYAGYISNEPFFLKQQAIKYKLFFPSDKGFDFYDDILFTSQKELQTHPKRVKKFKEASLKGWEYAFNHIDESVDFIYKNYNLQHKTKEALLFEANELKKLAYQGTTKIGKIEKSKVQRIYDVYKIMGLLKNPIDLDALVYSESILSLRERKYLRDKKELTACVLPNSAPYSALENGKYIGIGADILALAQEELHINYKILKDENEACDLLPIVTPTQERKKLFSFTTPYHYEPLVITTQTATNYILDIDTVLDKKFSVVKGHTYIQTLQKKYPKIKLVQVADTKEGILGVKKGKYYGHIDALVASAYAIKNISTKELQISGQLEEKEALGFAVRKDDAVLFGIFEKVSHNLHTSQLQKFLNNWVQINYTNTVRYPYIKEFVAFIVFMSLVFSLIYYILKKKNEALESLQKQILEVNKNLEVRVEESISNLERAQEVSRIGSWILDTTTQELSWSKETYKIFELETENSDKLFQSFLNRVHPEDRVAVIEAYDLSLAEKTSYSIEHRLLMDDGSIKYVLETCETTFDENLEPTISHGTVQDITQQVKAKEELEKKDVLMFQQSRLAQMGEMLSMIAHQWRQPLGSISASAGAIKTVLELEKYNFAEECERDAFLQYLDEKLNKIALYVQNLSQIITDFSSFYKPHKSAELLDVDEVVLKTYRLIEDSLLPTSIVVSFHLLAQRKIMMHENEFMQVVLNIITNAKEQLLSKKIVKPSIEIRSYLKNNKIYIEIEDNAGGIDGINMEEIFDPYFSTKLEKNGTGLGLYMSKIILKDYHNGDISAKNSKKGAIFTVTIDTSTPPSTTKRN